MGDTEGESLAFKEAQVTDLEAQVTDFASRGHRMRYHLWSLQTKRMHPIFDKMKSIIIIQTENKEQENALKAFAKALKMKFEVAKSKPYDSEFVAQIEESREQYKRGEFVTVEREDINSFLGL